MRIISSAALCASLLLLSNVSSYASESDFTMLPPTPYGSSSGCSSTGSMLTYNANAVTNGTSIAAGSSAINCVPILLDPTTGNFTTPLVVDQNWVDSSGNPIHEALAIDSNQIWKSVTTSDASLYFQTSNPGGATVIGGAKDSSGNYLNTNDLYVFGHIYGENAETVTGDVAITGNVTTALNATATGGNITAAGNLAAAGSVTAGGQVNTGGSISVGSACSPRGALAQSSDGSGTVLNCVNDKWASFGPSGPGALYTVNGSTSASKIVSGYSFCKLDSVSACNTGHLYSFTCDLQETDASTGTWKITALVSGSSGCQVATCRAACY